MKQLHSEYTIEDIPELLAEIQRLKLENSKLNDEKADMETMLEMASVHADEIGSDLLEKVDASIKEIEERVRLIGETIPVPVIIASTKNGKILYANELSASAFELSTETILQLKAADLYMNPDERQDFIKIMNHQGYVRDFHVRLKKKDNSIFWAALFSRQLEFKNESCMLTVIYDLTERMQAEEKIRSLSEELSQREEKYLMFFLAGQTYGIHLHKIKEIIGLIPITPLINAPNHIKGAANIRGKLIPVMDLRAIFGLEAADYNERTGIIILETKTTETGIIVDAVSEILSIKGKDIEPPPPLGKGIDSSFIAGMAKIGDGVKILLEADRLI